MNSKVYKWCMVPQCKNTSIKTPNKLFVYVPNKKTVRRKWLNLARRDSTNISINSAIYFCEDHFDLPNDMENYMQYHVMGSVSKVRMKPGCTPTKFECRLDRRKRSYNTTQRSYILKKQRKILIEESLKDYEEKQLELHETSSGSSVIHEINEIIKQEKHMTEDKSIQVHMPHKFSSIATQTEMSFTEHLTSPIKILEVKNVIDISKYSMFI